MCTETPVLTTKLDRFYYQNSKFMTFQEWHNSWCKLDLIYKPQKSMKTWSMYGQFIRYSAQYSLIFTYTLLTLHFQCFMWHSFRASLSKCGLPCHFTFSIYIECNTCLGHFTYNIIWTDAFTTWEAFVRIWTTVSHLNGRHQCPLHNSHSMVLYSEINILCRGLFFSPFSHLSMNLWPLQIFNTFVKFKCVFDTPSLLCN